MSGRTSGWPCVGAVQAVEADQLLLRDAPGIQEVLAVDAWLEGRRDIVDDVLRESYSRAHGAPVIDYDRLTSAAAASTTSASTTSRWAS